MTISIVTVGRNDNFGGNFVQRLEHNINKLISNIDFLKIDDIEIIITDWGSDVNSKLSDVMQIESRDYVKFLHINKELTEKYSPESKFSCPHAANAGIRRTSGKYIFYIDGDTYIPLSTFKKFYSFVKNLNDNYSFYWCSRIHIPNKLQITATNIKDMDSLIDDWINGGRLLVGPQEYWDGKGWCRNSVNLDNFGGGATGILLSRDICFESSFWWENLTKWGWMDVEYHKRLSSKYPCQGEISNIINEDFFHIGHHESVDESGQKNGFGGDIHGMNPSISPLNFQANGDNWGLFAEDLKLINK